MSLISPVLRSIEDNGLMFVCPGCECNHMIRYGIGDGPRWTWNNDADSPTFTPSILVRYTKTLVSTEEAKALMANREEIPHKDMVCHSFVTDGSIQYLGDCTHDLAGQTVPMVTFAEWEDETLDGK